MSDDGPGNADVASGGVAAQLCWGYRSATGDVREHNEDSVLAAGVEEGSERPPLFAVADGMGGHAVGEVASRVAIATIDEVWRRDGGGDPGKALRGAVRSANAAVLNAATEPGRAGMGTTLTALAVAGREAVVANVGDSRAYHVRGETCTQLTTDHTRVAELLRMRLISPAQAVSHPARSQLTRSLGADPLVQIDIVRTKVQPGDGLVVCSDGLWDVVGQSDLIRVIAATDRDAGTDDEALRLVHELVELAIKRGSADNVSAVVVLVRSGTDGDDAVGGRSRLFRRGRH
jgi:serine/threonine protein phosphatase PrpC